MNKTSSKGVQAMNSRTPAEQKEHRRQVTEAVRLMVAQALSHTEKFKALAKQFQVTEKMGREYIKWYHEDRKASKLRTKDNAREDAYERLDYLYREALDAGNLKLAVVITVEKAKMEDRLLPKQHQILTADVTPKGDNEQGLDYDAYTIEELAQLRALHNKGKRLKGTQE